MYFRTAYAAGSQYTDWLLAIRTFRRLSATRILSFSDGDIRMYIQQVVNATIETDIPQYADLTVSTARKLKRLLAIIAQSAPFKPNMSQIGGQLEVSRNNVADLCAYLEKAGLIGQLRTSTGGIQGLGKVDKIYLDNPTLIYTLAGKSVEIGTVRETFFSIRHAHSCL